MYRQMRAVHRQKFGYDLIYVRIVSYKGISELFNVNYEKKLPMKPCKELILAQYHITNIQSINSFNQPSFHSIVILRDIMAHSCAI